MGRSGAVPDPPVPDPPPDPPQKVALKGGEMAVEGFGSILKDVITTTAREMIFGGG